MPWPTKYYIVTNCSIEPEAKRNEAQAMEK